MAYHPAIANLHLPERCLIAAVMREDYVKVAGADDRLQAGDVVVALIEDSVFENNFATAA